LNASVHGGVFTQLAPWNGDRNPRSADLEAARAAARRGLHIERIVVVPDARRAYAGDVAAQLALDRASSVNARVVDVGSLMSRGSDSPLDPIEFALFDDEICLLREVDSRGAPGWRVTSDRHALGVCARQACLLREGALGVPVDPTVDLARPSMEEPLAASAQLARVVAPQLCLPARDGRPGCAPYHGLYPLLRVLGLAAAPDRHAAFYARELGALAVRGDFQRVLVSGTADQGMLAHVLRAYRGQGREPDLHMLDICPTPGVLCESYGRWAGAPVHAHTADVTEWRPSTPFDVVTTHSFIAKFPPGEHKRLFSSWRQALRAGGRLVTTARIDPEGTLDNAGFDAEQAEAFSRTLRTAVEPWSGLLGLDAGSLHDLALEHCAGIRSYAVHSEDGLVSALESAGFEVERLDRVVRQGRVGAASSGAGTHRTASYADFVAIAR
jgi:hypothetical protein